MKLVTTGPAILAAALMASLTLSCNRDGEKPQPATQPRQAANPQPTASPGAAMMQQFRAGCPMVVEDAKVSVSDTDLGVALNFTTEDGNADDLRSRVQHMARMYEMHQGQGQMMWHSIGTRGREPHRGTGMGMGMGMENMAGRDPMPAAKAKVTNLEDGARLELEPTDPSRLESLRQHARWHQKRMETGECWMLQGPDSPEPGGTTDGKE